MCSTRVQEQKRIDPRGWLWWRLKNSSEKYTYNMRLPDGWNERWPNDVWKRGHETTTVSTLHIKDAYPLSDMCVCSVLKYGTWEHVWFGKVQHAICWIFTTQIVVQFCFRYVKIFADNRFMIHNLILMNLYDGKFCWRIFSESKDVIIYYCLMHQAAVFSIMQLFVNQQRILKHNCFQ